MGLGELLFYCIFFALPALTLIWFIVSLILFLCAPKGSDKRKNRKPLFIASAITAGIVDGSAIAFFIMLMIAIAHM